jgi:hypothetical protein
MEKANGTGRQGELFGEARQDWQDFLGFQSRGVRQARQAVGAKSKKRWEEQAGEGQMQGGYDM